MTWEQWAKGILDWSPGIVAIFAGVPADDRQLLEETARCAIEGDQKAQEAMAMIEAMWHHPEAQARACVNALIGSDLPLAEMTRLIQGRYGVSKRSAMWVARGVKRGAIPLGGGVLPFKRRP